MPSALQPCVVERPEPLPGAVSSPPDPSDGHVRAGQLVRTLERQVIPQMVRAHRGQVGAEPLPGPEDLDRFVAQLLAGDEAGMQQRLASLRQQGVTVESLYLHLLAPAARALGGMWDQDLCDFPGVTVGTGRLQRLLRELSPDFEGEAPMPAHSGEPLRRILLAQPPHEQHSFGLSMVANFFRREGWLVDGGVGSGLPDPALRAQAEWFDVVGYSCGSQSRLPWVRDAIVLLRASSRNPQVVVMVGGPAFIQHPEWARAIGADLCVTEAQQAPMLAAGLVAARATKR